MINQSATKIQLASMALLVLLCGAWTVKGIKENLDHNDYDVIRMGAEIGIGGGTDFYSAKLEIKDRHFVYPPAAAILLGPMAMVPLEVGAVASAVLKGIMLFVLALWAAKGAHGGEGRWWAAAPTALAAVIVLFRPIDNDFGNGQVNIHLALLAIGGMVLMLSPSKAMNGAGAVLFGVAVAIKPPPVLIAGALVLGRRWIAFGLAVGMIVAISLGLPIAWFGVEDSRFLFKEYSNRTDEMLFDAKDGDQISFYEALIFVSSQWSAPDGLEVESRKLYTRVDGEKKRFRLENPFSIRTAKMLWLGMSAAVGLCFLMGRWKLASAGRIDAMWDVAVLAVLCILLSPLARKAHLVILMYPVCWIMGRILNEAMRSGWKRWIGWNRLDAALVGGFTAGFYVSDDLAVPVPGFPMPLRPALLVAAIILLALLWRLANREPSGDPEWPA